MQKMRMLPIKFFRTQEEKVNFLATITQQFSLMKSLWVQQGNLSHAQISYVQRVKFSLSGSCLVVKELPSLILAHSIFSFTMFMSEKLWSSK